MKTKPVIFLLTIWSMTLYSMVTQFIALPKSEAIAQTPSSNATQSEPVERDMHEFMEYVFQPTYKRLKEAMKSKPADKKDWLELKSGSLVLAEGGNLLLLRAPQENATKWNELAISVRDYGGKMYRAAHATDFLLAEQNYKAMLKSCNACHQEFANGEYQLAP